MIAIHLAIGALLLARPQPLPLPQHQPPTVLLDIKMPTPLPPPEHEARRSGEEAGAPGKKAEPAPIVVPAAPIQLPTIPTVAVASDAGSGSASTAGSSTAGQGVGAGGSGSGRGGGGDGSGFAGYSPARLIRNVRRNEYRNLAAGRLSGFSALVSLRIDTDGEPTNCRVIRSSGDAFVDAGLCPLITNRLKFRPALDNRGRPIPYSLQYVATWQP